MKRDTASAAPARFKRLGRTIFVLLTATFFVVATAPTASAAPCIPMNDRFVGPLRPLVREIIGGVGGLIPIVVSILIIALIVWGMFKVFKSEDISNIFKGIISVPLVVIIGIAVLILVNAIITVLNGLCSNNPF